MSIFAVFALVACEEPAAGPSWPDETWTVSTPEAEGVDSAGLLAALDALAADDVHAHQLVVVRNGRIVLDAPLFPYDAAAPHDLGSITKSLTSAGVQASIARGDLDGLDATASSFFPERVIANDGPDKRALTLAHLLTMTAGFACVSEPAEQTLIDMQASDDWVGFALDLPMVSAPGASWVYCSSNYQIASAVVTRVSGRPVDALLVEDVLGPVGATSLEWPRGDGSNANGWGDARMSARDLARLGLLFANDGAWSGSELLDRAWLERATTDRVGTIGPDGGYGLGFWPAGGGRFYARGTGGQFLYVAPDLALVVVTLGSAGVEEIPRFAAVLRDALLPAVRAEGALPPNPAAASALAARAAELRAPPPPRDVQVVPAAWRGIDGASFALAPNVLGWTTISPRLGASTLELVIEIGATRSTALVGLDGVARISRGIDFAGPGRYRRIDVALDGRFDGDDLVVSFDTIEAIHAGEMTLALDGGALRIDVHERTFFAATFTLTGAREP